MRPLLGLIALAWWQSMAVAAVPAADLLWQSGDYRGAFAKAIEPAIRGDAHSQFLIGEAYRLGRSVEVNFPQAEYWYTRAARHGDSAAAAELGLLLASRNSGAAALPWLTIAARHGDPRALCSLAALFFNGDSVARDAPLAYALMLRAAQTGLPEASARLATLRALLPADIRSQGEALAQTVLASPALSADARAPQAPGLAASALSAPVRIQVGAFRSAAAAEQAWTLLSERIDGMGPADHAVVQAGAVFRLQAHLPDQSAANDFRRRLKAARWQNFTREGKVTGA